MDGEHREEKGRLRGVLSLACVAARNHSIKTRRRNAPPPLNQYLSSGGKRRLAFEGHFWNCIFFRQVPAANLLIDLVAWSIFRLEARWWTSEEVANKPSLPMRSLLRPQSSLIIKAARDFKSVQHSLTRGDGKTKEMIVYHHRCTLLSHTLYAPFCNNAQSFVDGGCGS